MCLVTIMGSDAVEHKRISNVEILGGRSSFAAGAGDDVDLPAVRPSTDLVIWLRHRVTDKCKNSSLKGYVHKHEEQRRLLREDLHLAANI